MITFRRTYRPTTMYLLVTGLILLSSTIHSQMITNNGIPVTLIEKLEKFKIIYLQKCAKALDVQTLQNLILETGQCITIQSSSVLPVQEVCSIYDSKITPCLKKFANTVKGCLDSNEKYLPDFLIDGQSRVLKKFCASKDADHIKNLENAKCTKPFAEALNADLLQVCVPKLKIIQNLDKSDYSLNRPDVCSDLKTLQECMVGSIKSNCEIAKADIDFVDSLLLEFRADCTSNSAKINIASLFLLAVLLIFSKLFS